jgi:PHP family Zn ribbon phosphoesterase
MDNKEIPKIIEFDALKRGKTNRQVCQCGIDAYYVIDEENMVVDCSKCGGRVDPFKALVNIADYNSNFQKQLRQLEKQKRDLHEYESHKPIIKKLESKLIESNKGRVNQGTKYYPLCPCCKEPFELEEIADKWYGGIYLQQQLITRQNKQKRNKEKE